MESLLFNLSSGYAIGDTVEVIPQHVKHFVSNPLPIPSSKRKRFDTVSYDNTTSMAKCIDTRLLVLYVTMFETNRELESISSAPQSFSSTYSKVIQHFQAMFRLPDYTLLKTREKNTRIVHHWFKHAQSFRRNCTYRYLHHINFVRFPTVPT